MFILFDKAGNVAYAYCMDSATNTNKTYRYMIENLEEADYFVGTEEEQTEAKAHVRAIALYGGAEARMMLIQQYLIGDYLKEKVAGENRETNLIDKDSFLNEDSLTLAIGDKVAEHANNSDTNDTNDVYSIDLFFAMVVEPTANDDLFVILYTIASDGSVNELRKARLAGDATGDDETYSELIRNGNSYTFRDIQMAENSDLTFDLKVEGTQNLAEGV